MPVTRQELKLKEEGGSEQHVLTLAALTDHRIMGGRGLGKGGGHRYRGHTRISYNCWQFLGIGSWKTAPMQRFT